MLWKYFLLLVLLSLFSCLYILPRHACYGTSHIGREWRIPVGHLVLLVDPMAHQECKSGNPPGSSLCSQQVSQGALTIVVHLGTWPCMQTNCAKLWPLSWCLQDLLLWGGVFLYLPHLRSYWVMGLPGQLPPPPPAAEGGSLVTGSWWLQGLYPIPFPLRSPGTAPVGTVHWLLRCLQGGVPSIPLWFPICGSWPFDLDLPLFSPLLYPTIIWVSPDLSKSIRSAQACTDTSTEYLSSLKRVKATHPYYV